jgi:hypothetical protein
MITGTGTNTTPMNSVQRLLVGQYEEHVLNQPTKRVSSWLQKDSIQIEDFFLPLLRERNQIPTVGRLLDTASVQALHRPHETFRTLIHFLPRQIEVRALFNKHLNYATAETITPAVFIYYTTA